MLVERVKYTIWAADMERAVRFYRDLCGGRGRTHHRITVNDDPDLVAVTFSFRS